VLNQLDRAASFPVARRWTSLLPCKSPEAVDLIASLTV